MSLEYLGKIMSEYPNEPLTIGSGLSGDSYNTPVGVDTSILTPYNETLLLDRGYIFTASSATTTYNLADAWTNYDCLKIEFAKPNGDGTQQYGTNIIRIKPGTTGFNIYSWHAQNNADDGICMMYRCTWNNTSSFKVAKTKTTFLNTGDAAYYCVQTSANSATNWVNTMINRVWGVNRKV